MNKSMKLKRTYIVLVSCLVGIFAMMISGSALAEKIVIRVWDVTQEPENTLMKETIIPAFQNLYPGVSVELETIPPGDLRQKLLTAFTAGRGPDLAWANIPYLMELGYAKPIPEEIVDDEYMTKNYLAGHDYKYKGKRYFIPTGTMGCILYYNKDILAKAGISAEDIGKTWTDSTATFQRLTIWKGPMLVQAGYAFNGYGTVEFAEYIRQQAPFYSKVSEGRFRIHLNTPEAKNAIGQVLDYFDEYRVNDRGFLNWNEAFGLGKAAIVPWWTWGEGYLRATYPDIKWGAAPYPTYTGHGPYGFSNEIDNIYLVTTTAESEKLEAVWKFWQFLSMKDENVREICKAKGIVPLKLSLMEDPWISEREDLVVLKEQMRDPHGGQIFFGSAVTATDVNLARTYEDIILGGEDIEKSLIAAEKAINEDLAKQDYWILDYRE